MGEKFDNTAAPLPRGVPDGRSVVFFDGVCALCHGSMKMLMEKDHARVLSFAPLQGETFAAVRDTLDLDAGLDSIIYVRGHGTGDAQAYVRSDAILRIARDLGGLWRVASWARVIPRFIRNPLYDFIARNRYRWFGKYDTCRMPSEGDGERLLP